MELRGLDIILTYECTGRCAHCCYRAGPGAGGTMTVAEVERHLVARLAAYRNVWWSLANEYDLMQAKRTADWDRFFRIVQESDPYQHLRSIHNCRQFYDHGKPWVTHCSIQHHDLTKATKWRELYGKPVVVDECDYEGDIERRRCRFASLNRKGLMRSTAMGTTTYRVLVRVDHYG